MDKPDNRPPPGHQTPTRAHPGADPAQGLRDISHTLLAMRDALTRLSLALKDWQFENDLVRRGNVQDIAQKLFASLSAPAKPPGGDASGS